MEIDGFVFLGLVVVDEFSFGASSTMARAYGEDQLATDGWSVGKGGLARSAMLAVNLRSYCSDTMLKSKRWREILELWKGAYIIYFINLYIHLVGVYIYPGC